MINLYGQAPKPDIEVIRRVKRWTQEAFALPDEAAVMVTEIRCAEDDCPDVETVIAVLDEPNKARLYKLFRPVADVTRDDVMSLAARETHD